MLKIAIGYRVQTDYRPRRHASPSTLFACVLLASALTGARLAWAQGGVQAGPADMRRPAEVAQVLFGIVSYVRWPVARPEVRICLAGAVRHGAAIVDSPASSLGQRIRVRTIPPASAGSDCDVLYFGALPDAERDILMTQVIGKPILSISEPGVPCQVGTQFCLRLQEAQIGFDVNLDAIARSGLRVHPNALQIGRRKAVQP